MNLGSARLGVPIKAYTLDQGCCTFFVGRGGSLRNILTVSLKGVFCLFPVAAGKPLATRNPKP